MNARAALLAPLRQRLPFLPLVACAVAGIVASDRLPIPAAAWLAVALAGAGTFLLRRRGFTVFCLASFAVIHLWQGRESPAARLADWLGPRELPAQVTGLVADDPVVFREDHARLRLRTESLTIDGITVPASLPLTVDWSGPPPALGDRVTVRGTMASLDPPRNPGQFDFAAWSRRQGIHSRLRVSHPTDAAIDQAGDGLPLRRFALRCRERMRDVLSRGIDDPLASELIVAMVLGETSSISERVQEAFRGTGTYHLFSVSGLHVGMVGVILWFVLRALRVPQPAAAACIIPMLFFYALMTGLKPASVRAAVMAAIVLIGLMSRRRPVLLNNLCAAAFLILLADTNQLFNAGFQLSFTVVASILVLAKPVNAALERPFLPDPFLPVRLVPRWRRWWADAGRKFCGLAAVSVAAWTGSLPLTLGYFHLISLSALPCNLLVVPMAFGVMAVAMLSVAAAPFSAWISITYNQANWLLASALVSVVQWFAGLPGAYVFLGPQRQPAPLAEMVVFDFGAGGATWLRTGHRQWLLDCGPLRFHDSVLVPFLRSQGARALDGLVVTHGDAGHLGAAEELLASCPPARIIDSPLEDRSPRRAALHAALAARSKPKSLVRAGDWITFGSHVRAEILHPPSGFARPSADDKAIVIRLDVGPTRILFLSDAGFTVEQHLLRTAREKLAADILVKGAPGQGPSADPAFLDAVRPRVVIATAATFPESEILTPSFEENLRHRGATLFRQDATGAVRIRIFSTHWEVSAFLGGRHFTRIR